MLRNVLRALLASASLVIVSHAWDSRADRAEAGHPDLFYNFYQGPSPYAGGVPAQMLISPRPTPPMVGHTWITYQPLMPNEMMYRHHRTYYRYYPNGGHSSTHVCWW